MLRNPTLSLREDKWREAILGSAWKEVMRAGTGSGGCAWMGWLHTLLASWQQDMKGAPVTWVEWGRRGASRNAARRGLTTRREEGSLQSLPLPGYHVSMLRQRQPHQRQQCQHHQLRPLHLLRHRRHQRQAVGCRRTAFRGARALSALRTRRPGLRLSCRPPAARGRQLLLPTACNSLLPWVTTLGHPPVRLRCRPRAPRGPPRPTLPPGTRGRTRLRPATLSRPAGRRTSLPPRGCLVWMRSGRKAAGGQAEVVG